MLLLLVYFSFTTASNLHTVHSLGTSTPPQAVRQTYSVSQ